MKRRYAFIFTILMLLTLSFLYSINIEKGNDELNKALLSLENSAEHIPVLIVLKDQYDVNQLYNEVKDLPKKERREKTISRLKEFSNNSQRSVRKYISESENRGDLSNPSFLWITNAISVQASVKALKDLDHRKEIKSLIYASEIEINNESVNEGYSDWNGDQTRDGEIGLLITKTGADKAWEQGYYGQDVVVALLGTGVNYNKNDIKNNLWTDPSYPYHGYNFLRKTFETYNNDQYSPGTQFAGIIAGDGTDGFKTGVAPKAKLMIVVVGSGSSSDLDVSATLKGIQFAIENNADLISLKADMHLTASVRKSIRNTMVNTLSAGLIVVVGVNDKHYLEKPVTEIVAPIADCPPPWLHPDQTERGGVSAVLTTAETDFSDGRWGATKGPVTWQDVEGYEDYPYDPGIGLIKPDLCAPGYRVTTLSADEEKGYIETQKTGISSAAVAGAIAIMLSKDPELTPEEIAQILEENALKLSDKKNNTFGSGRLDVFSSCEAITDNRAPGVPFIISPLDKGENVVTDPVFKWEKNRATTSYTLYLGTDNPPTNLVNGLNLTEPVYKHSSALKPATTHYWKLVAHHNEMSTESEVMSFNTELPPEINFEDGEFSHYDWEFTTTGENSKEWFVTDKTAYLGSYSAQSGAIGHNSSTQMRITLNVKEDGFISFYIKTSTEKTHDRLLFAIDNVSMGEWSGETDWQRITFPIKNGLRVLSWTYRKDPMSSSGSDAVWVDSIILPPHIKPFVAHTPEKLSINFSYEHLDLNWEIEKNDEPYPHGHSFKGFNIYLSVDGSEYEKLNADYLFEQSYCYQFENAGEYSFYVTASYTIDDEIVETERSEIVTTTIHPPLVNPVITPEGGEYKGPITVTIESESEGCEIFFTVDGSEPTYESLRYTEPIKLTESATVRSRAYKFGHLPSSVTTATYLIETLGTEEVALPHEFSVRAFPNPYRKSSNVRSADALNIELSIPTALSRLDVGIYNIKGQLIREFSLSNVHKGKQLIQWDLLNSYGKEAKSGVYFIKLNVDDKLHHKRVMILR